MDNTFQQFSCKRKERNGMVAGMSVHVCAYVERNGTVF